MGPPISEEREPGDRATQNFREHSPFTSMGAGYVHVGVETREWEAFDLYLSFTDLFPPKYFLLFLSKLKCSPQYRDQLLVSVFFLTFD